MLKILVIANYVQYNAPKNQKYLSRKLQKNDENIFVCNYVMHLSVLYNFNLHITVLKPILTLVNVFLSTMYSSILNCIVLKGATVVCKNRLKS